MRSLLVSQAALSTRPYHLPMLGAPQVSRCRGCDLRALRYKLAPTWRQCVCARLLSSTQAASEGMQRVFWQTGAQR